MKRIAFLALAAASLAFAQDAALAPAPTPQAALEAPATPEDYKAILREALDISEALGNVIAEVKDLATADDAADKVAALAARLKEIKAKANAMGDPSKELRQVLDAYMENQSDRINAIELKFRAMSALMERDCFGSEKLKKAMLLPILMKVMGDVPEDEPPTLEEEEEEAPAPEK
ncbi:MAG: hypothetical protein ACI4XO_00615 [Akkermansia sp.]